MLDPHKLPSRLSCVTNVAFPFSFSETKDGALSEPPFPGHGEQYLN